MSVREAATLLQSHKAQAVVVLEQGRPCKVLTASELLGALLDGAAGSLADLPGSVPCLVPAETRLDVALARMGTAAVRPALVVAVDAQGSYVGAASEREVLRPLVLASRTEALIRQTRLAVCDRMGRDGLESVLYEIASRLEQAGSGWRVAILLRENGALRVGAAPSLPDAALAALLAPLQPLVAESAGPAGDLDEMLVADMRRHPLWKASAAALAELDLHACWWLPCSDEAGHLCGALAVCPAEALLPDADEMERLRAFVQITADAVQRVRVAEARRQAEVLLHSMRDGVVITDLQGHIKAVNPAYCALTGYDEAELLGHQPALLRSGRHDPEFYAALWQQVRNSGHWQGEIWQRHKDGRIYRQWLSLSTVPDDQGMPSRYVGVCSDMDLLRDAELHGEPAASRDLLQQMPDRTIASLRLRHALARANRRGRMLAVLAIDLDRLRSINDSLGLSVGDELLAGFARRVRGRTREADTLARLGDDEFLLVLEDIEQPDDAALVAQSLLEVLAEPLRLRNGQQIGMSASIGLSLYPDDGREADELIQHADTAMYRAKAQGGRTFRFHAEERMRLAQERLGLEAQLRRALQQGEFVLHYQPLIDTRARRTVAVEALLRWQHPERGLLGPEQFIPLAEKTGLILPLGDWVLATACRQARHWFCAGQPLIMAVNLSARQFLQPDLVARVQRILAETALPPALLELDISENVLMERPEATIDRLHELRALGVQLSVDDYGTGTSSLAYLKRLPVQRLKIDRSFIDGLSLDRNDQAIVQATITMAHTLGMRALAEGVETTDQLDVLRRLQCDFGQGFLFSQAMPGADLDRWLVTGRTTAGLH